MRPCDWSCHDIGCHHGSGGFLDQVGDAFTSIAGSAVISIETYQVLNLLIFALGAPLLISVLWGRLVGLKAWWIVLFWLLTGAAVLPFTDEAYRWCVEAMIWLANVTPLFVHGGERARLSGHPAPAGANRNWGHDPAPDVW